MARLIVVHCAHPVQATSAAQQAAASAQLARRAELEEKALPLMLDAMVRSHILVACCDCRSMHLLLLLHMPRLTSLTARLKTLAALPTQPPADFWSCTRDLCAIAVGSERGRHRKHTEQGVRAGAG